MQPKKAHISGYEVIHKPKHFFVSPAKQGSNNGWVVPPGLDPWTSRTPTPIIKAILCCSRAAIWCPFGCSLDDVIALNPFSDLVKISIANCGGGLIHLKLCLCTVPLILKYRCYPTHKQETCLQLYLTAVANFR